MAVEDSQAEYRRALGREGHCGESCPSGDDGLGDMPHSRWLFAGLRRSSTAGCGAEDVRAAECRAFRSPPWRRAGGYSTPSDSPCGTVAGRPVGESAVDRIELSRA